MLPKKNQRRKTDISQIQRISLKQLRHKSVTPASFPHDIVVEIFLKDMLKELAGEAIEQIQQTHKVQESARQFMQGQFELLEPFYCSEPSFLQLNREEEMKEPESQPTYAVKAKNKISRIPATQNYRSTMGSEELLVWSGASNQSLITQKQILNKLKKQYRDKLKWSKENLPAMRLQGLKEEQTEDSYVNKSLRVFKKYARELQCNLNETSEKTELKQAKDEQYTYGSDGKPLKMKRIETQMFPVKSKDNPKIIKADLLDKNVLTNAKADLVKFKIKLSRTDHRPPAPFTEKGKISGQTAQACISRGFRSVAKGIRIRDSQNSSLNIRSRSSFVKLPRI